MSSGSPDRRMCVITGAGGFVGKQLAAVFERDGWEVNGWSSAAPGKRRFRLGEPVDPRRFQGVQALVHCAYDFRPRTRQSIYTTNVEGSRRLIEAASQAGVPQIVFISSLSAFPGCRSLYGQAKLEIESCAISAQGLCLRPGLIYGDAPGGVFGKLVSQARKSTVVPLLTGGPQLQYLLHMNDLAEGILRCLLKPNARWPVDPVAIAAPEPRTLRSIIEEIARALQRPVRFFPVPWQLGWLGLKTLELAKVPTNFRSDSLISMIHQNPNPSFALSRQLGFQCRRFLVTREMLSALDAP
jgi:nucleoside-diphosphate-sugar epimerase